MTPAKLFEKIDAAMPGPDASLTMIVPVTHSRTSAATFGVVALALLVAVLAVAIQVVGIKMEPSGGTAISREVVAGGVIVMLSDEDYHYLVMAIIELFKHPQSARKSYRKKPSFLGSGFP